jgi:hypothetical protein
LTSAIHERIPIALEHGRPERAHITVIDWALGNRCNFACSYCPPVLHDGSLGWPSIETAMSFVERAIAHYRSSGRRLFFQLSGGEPTVYSHLQELCEFIKANDAAVGLISNGSRTERWWSNSRHLFDQVVLTHHVEFIDIDHFIAVAQLLSESVRVHVNITMLSERFDECYQRGLVIEERCPNVSVSLKPLLVNFGSRLYDYTAEQLLQLRERRRIPSTAQSPAFRGNMIQVFSNEERVDVRASEMVVRKENNWRGWLCHAGEELLHVSFRGEVFRATCKEGGLLGNIVDPMMVFPSAPIICTKPSCHCLTDIMCTKVLPSPSPL